VPEQPSLRIPYAKPSITDLEIAYAADAAKHGWGERCYAYIERFEAGFARHLGVRHAIATSSCTGALHMGLHALGVGPGDEVVLADSNWVATVAPIVHLGATPVFVDVLPDTWCLDPAQVEAALTPRTRAIIAVHLYGNLSDMEALLAIGARHGIPVVEDAAEAIGSVYRGRRAGSLGRFGVFSFHGTKTLSTGEGGMFVTDDPDLYERVLTLSNHGRARGQARQFWPEEVGYKYKMSNLQAAIGCAQLERVEELVAAKQAVFRAYAAKLAGCPVTLNPEQPGCVNGCWMPTIVQAEGAPVRKEPLMEALRREGVDARVFFWPLSTTPVVGRRAFSGRHVAAELQQRALNLPSFHDITAEEIDAVARVVRRVLS
jgi:perosamine synthetase